MADTRSIRSSFVAFVRAGIMGQIISYRVQQYNNKDLSTWLPLGVFAGAPVSCLSVCVCGCGSVFLLLSCLYTVKHTVVDSVSVSVSVSFLLIKKCFVIIRLEKCCKLCLCCGACWHLSRCCAPLLLFLFPFPFTLPLLFHLALLMSPSR